MKKLFSSLLLIILFSANVLATFTMSITGGAPMVISPTYVGNTNFQAAPIELTCQSDLGNPWELQVYATGDLTDSSAGHTLPLERLKWFGAYKSSGSGDFFKALPGSNESIPLSLVNDTVYTDTGASSNANIVQVGLGVVVPDVQPQGNYQTTVRFIMTE